MNGFNMATRCKGNRAGPAPRGWLLGVVSWFCLTLLSSAAVADEDRSRPRIVNGLNSHLLPTTGALLYPSSGGPINEDNAGSWCSGTLIGCETFLTAAHCVEEDSSPSRYWVFLQHGGIRSVKSIHSHPSYTSAGFPSYDVAVLKLGEPVHGIDPTEINTVASPSFGTSGIIAGFGQTSGSAGDYGIKRWGQVVTRNCGSSGSNDELVCWRFANPVGAPGEDSNTCNGDSGGPLFADLGSGEMVVGITSGGNAYDCLATDDSYDTNVYTFRNFIAGHLGTDSTSTCGALPAVGAADVDVTGFDGQLNNGNSTATHTISVPSGANELRVALKGEDNSNPLNADLYVKQGSSVGVSNYDCKSDGQASVGFCTLSAPAQGDWSVLVKRVSGVGEYQVTATVFGGDPPVCGNGELESGEQCDGADDSACPGACDSGCACPAPVCGNGVVEGTEQCDGGDASACPTGVCGSDCGCQEPVCGNDLVEEGEACDGSDDSMCSGSCQGNCQCAPVSCSPDLWITNARSDAKRFVWKGEIDNFSGAYDGLDPRDGFSFVVTQGSKSVTVTVPAGDSGWSRSKPNKGRYIWKGSRDGLQLVRFTDRTSKKGVWQVIVKGRAVPGAGEIDVKYDYADLQLTSGSQCVGGMY